MLEVQYTWLLIASEITGHGILKFGRYYQIVHLKSSHCSTLNPFCSWSPPIFREREMQLKACFLACPSALYKASGLWEMPRRRGGPCVVPHLPRSPLVSGVVPAACMVLSRPEALGAHGWVQKPCNAIGSPGAQTHLKSYHHVRATAREHVQVLE